MDSTKPIYASFMGEKDVASGINILQLHKIPHFTLPEFMCSAFHSVHHFNKNLKSKIHHLPELGQIQNKLAQELMKKVKSNGRSFIPEVETIEILQTYGLPVPRGNHGQIGG